MRIFQIDRIDYQRGPYENFLLNPEILPDPFGNPGAPPANIYGVPRRLVEDEDDLIVMRYREDKICSLFRQDGFLTRAEIYRVRQRTETLNYLWEWRMANEHIPESFLMHGTYG